MKIEVLREIKAKDYSSGSLASNPIQNGIYRQGGRGSDLAECWTRIVTDGRLLQRAVGDNRKRFLKKFGKPAFHYQGEFDFHCWPLLITEKGRQSTLLVMTAAGKGTCYEYLSGEQDEQLVVKFLKMIARMR